MVVQNIHCIRFVNMIPKMSVVISFQGKEKYFFLLKELGIETYSLNAGYFSINKFFSNKFTKVFKS